MKIYPLLILIVVYTVSTASAYECIYSPKPTEKEPHGEMSPQGDCLKIEEGGVWELQQGHFHRLDFREDNLAWIVISEPDFVRAFYVSAKGKVVRTYYYDNGPDDFAEGYARTISNGKFGYINKELQIVIAPEYDFAFPFENGSAVVCNQCKVEMDGEHKKVEGGVWGLIDKGGRVIQAVNLERDELLRR